MAVFVIFLEGVCACITRGILAIFSPVFNGGKSTWVVLNCFFTFDKLFSNLASMIIVGLWVKLIANVRLSAKVNACVNVLILGVSCGVAFAPFGPTMDQALFWENLNKARVID